VVVNGQAALNSLITSSQPGVFQGANVTINLEEQNFNTTNQVTSNTNYPAGGAGEIQFNSGSNSFASNAYFTYDNSNVITPGIRTDGYFYSNGAPFIGGGNAAIGNFVFTGDTMSISDDANASLTIRGNSLGNNDNNIVINPTSIDIYAYNSSPYSYSELYLDNSNVSAPYAQIIVDGNATPQQTWNFDHTGNLTLPGNTFAVKYANNQPVVIGGGNASFLSNGSAQFTLLSDYSLLSGNTTNPHNFKINDTYTPDIDLRNASATGMFTQGANATIRTAGTYNWNFGSTGNTQFPTGIVFADTDLIAAANTYIEFASHNGNTYVGVDNDNAFIQTDFNANNYIWTFAATGGTIFPTLTVQRGDNPSETISGQTLLFGDATKEAIISTPDGTVGNEYSQRLVINPGAGNNFGEGGDIYLWAGRGGANGGSGGDVKIRGGYAPADGTGGYIRIDGGASQANGAPGFIEITGGRGGTTSGGYIQITGGVGGSGTGGAVDLIGGFGQAGPGANVGITGGGSSNGLAEYGNVNIGSGASTWSFKNNGTTQFPNNTIQTANNQSLTIRTPSSGNAYSIMYQSSNSWEAYAEDDDTGAYSAHAWIKAELPTANTPLVFIENVRGNDGLVSTWTFDDAGNITLPNLGIIASQSGRLLLHGGSQQYVDVKGGQGLETAGGDARLRGGDALSETADPYDGGNAIIRGGSGINGGVAGWVKIQGGQDDSTGNLHGNVSIATYIPGSQNRQYWTFDDTGNLSLPNNTVIGNAVSLTTQGPAVNSFGSNSYTGTFTTLDYANLDTTWIVNGPGVVNGTIQSINAAGQTIILTRSIGSPQFQNGQSYTFTGPLVGIGSNITVNNQSWTFGADGEFYLPTGGRLGATKGGTMLDAGNGFTTSLTSFYGNGYFSSCVNAGPSGMLYITAYNDGGPNPASQWTFDNNGNFSLPQGGVITEGNIPAYTSLTGNTIVLTPSGGTSADQQLVIYPTATPGADANHLHLTSGNLYNTELFLGDDFLYVKLANTGNIVINSNDLIGNSAQWIFGTDGNLTTPGASGNISGADVISANVFTAPGNVSIAVNDGNVWQFGLTGNLTFPTGMHIDNEGPNTRISQNEGFLKMTAGGNATYQVGWAEFEGTGSGNTALVIANTSAYPGTITIRTANQGVNQYDWTFGTSGNLTLPTGAILGNPYNDANAVGLQAGSNSYVIITSDNLQQFVQANTTAIAIGTNYGNGDTQKWIFDQNGNLAAPGNISTTGNITAAYFSGNGSGLTGVGAASVPSQNILPTIQSIAIANTSNTGTASSGQGWANVTVANVISITEYGVIITSGTSSQKFATGALGNIPGTEKINFTTAQTGQLFTVYAYVTSNAGTYYSTSSTGTSGICLLAGTQIALSDGSHKAIEDITYTDKLLSWDFDRGCYAETTALWIKRSETGSQYNLLTFSDGTTLRTFDQHRIFNKQAGAFTYPMTDATPVGTVTVNEHGQEITLTNKQVIEDTIDYYNVITDHHMNLFSDTVLTSCRFNNIYPITDMKFVKDSRTPRTRAEFANIPDRFFHGLRLTEQIVDVDTAEWYVNRLLATEVSTQVELIS